MWFVVIFLSDATVFDDVIKGEKQQQTKKE